MHQASIYTEKSINFIAIGLHQPRSPEQEVEREREREEERKKIRDKKEIAAFRGARKEEVSNCDDTRRSSVWRTSVAAATAFLHRFSTFECALHIFVCRFMRNRRYSRIPASSITFIWYFMYFMQIHDTKMRMALVHITAREPNVWRAREANLPPIHLQYNPVAHRKHWTRKIYEANLSNNRSACTTRTVGLNSVNAARLQRCAGIRINERYTKRTIDWRVFVCVFELLRLYPLRVFAK